MIRYIILLLLVGCTPVGMFDQEQQGCEPTIKTITKEVYVEDEDKIDDMEIRLVKCNTSLSRFREKERTQNAHWTRCPGGKTKRLFYPISEKESGVDYYFEECTGSMLPFINCNNTLEFCYINRHDPINVGDIIIYKTSNRYVEHKFTIHRIVGFKGSIVHTSGYSYEDYVEEVPRQDIIGKVDVIR